MTPSIIVCEVAQLEHDVRLMQVERRWQSALAAHAARRPALRAALRLHIGSAIVSAGKRLQGQRLPQTRLSGSPAEMADRRTAS